MSFAGLDRRVALPAAIAALALAGCEGDEPMQTTAPAVTAATDTADSDGEAGGVPADEPALDPKADKDLIKAALWSVLVGGQACGDALVTERYLRRAYGGRSGCRAAQAHAANAKRVHVSRVVVLPGSVAQASVVPTGGVYDGERLRAELVFEKGIWKLDSLRSNVPVGP